MSYGLEEFEEPERPLYSSKRRTAMRVVVSVAILALVLPGVLITWVTQVQTATYACQVATAYYAPGALGSRRPSNGATRRSSAGIVMPKYPDKATFLSPTSV